MKTSEIKSATVATLKQIAKDEKVNIPAKAKKPEIVELLTIHFSPKDEAKGEAVENSKAAKRPDLPQKAKLAKVYDTFRVLLADGEEKVDSVDGVTAQFWKAREDAADFGGVTLRFSDEVKAYGADRAILHNLRKALKGCGITTRTVVLRKGGSGAIYV